MKLGYRPNRIEQLTIIHELEKQQASASGREAFRNNFIVHHVLDNRESCGKVMVQCEATEWKQGKSFPVFFRAII